MEYFSASLDDHDRTVFNLRVLLITIFDWSHTCTAFALLHFKIPFISHSLSFQRIKLLPTLVTRLHKNELQFPKKISKDTYA